MADIYYIRDVWNDQYSIYCSSNPLNYKTKYSNLSPQQLLWLYASLLDKSELSVKNQICIPIKEIAYQLGLKPSLIREGIEYLQAQRYLETVKLYLKARRSIFKKHSTHLRGYHYV